jgi:hypothetical protein
MVRDRDEVQMNKKSGMKLIYTVLTKDANQWQLIIKHLEVRTLKQAR